MALLDQVKKSLTSGFQLPQFGQSARIKELQAATAGRTIVGGEGGPAQRSMAETVAAAAAQQQQKEDVLQGEVAAAGLEQQAKEQEQQFQQRTAMLDEQALNSRQQMLNKTQEILQDFSQRRGELDFKENSSRVQYALASLRMSNDDYLDRLEAEAARSRLDDQTAFEWELTQSIFADEMELFKNDLAFKHSMNADERAFRDYLAEIDIDQAIQLSGMDIQAAETAAQYKAGGEFLSAGVQAVGQAAKEGYFKSEPKGVPANGIPLQSAQNKENTVGLNPAVFKQTQNPMKEFGWPAQALEGYQNQQDEKLLENITKPISISELDY